MPDWYIIEFYGVTNLDGSSDTDGDGFNLGAEYIRGYHPQLVDQVMDGGISRRQSGIITVAVVSQVAVTAVSDPAGLYSDSKTLTNGASYNLPAQPAAAGYSFIGWYVDTNRLMIPTAFPPARSALSSATTPPLWRNSSPRWRTQMATG